MCGEGGREYHSLNRNSKERQAPQRRAALREVSSEIHTQFQSPFGAATLLFGDSERGTRVQKGTPAPHTPATLQSISEDGVQWCFCRSPGGEAHLSLVGFESRSLSFQGAWTK